MIFSKNSLMSSTKPGSYSKVVKAPVEPGTNKLALPSVRSDFFRPSFTRGVISKISVFPLVLREIVSVKTTILLLLTTKKIFRARKIFLKHELAKTFLPSQSLYSLLNDRGLLEIQAVLSLFLIK